jgi:hypothetical protein
VNLTGICAGRAWRAAAVIVVLAGSIAPAAAQQGVKTSVGPSVTRLVAEPAELKMVVGQTLPFKVTAYDAQGKVLPKAAVRVTGPMRSIGFADGQATAFRADVFTAVATSIAAPGAAPVMLEIPVTIGVAPLGRLEILPAARPLYTGVTLEHSVRGFDAGGRRMNGLGSQPGSAVTWRSSDPSIATVDRFGNLTAHKPGTVTLTVQADSLKAERRYTVVANPIARFDLGIADTLVRTGDVIRLAGVAKGANGQPVPDAPITWSYTYIPDDTVGNDLVGAAPRGGAGIIDDGRFVANYPGRFTLLAQVGGVHARQTIEVKPRDVVQRVKVTSRGPILNTHTSDLWPWTGKDGRDYCLVGTWGGDGWAFVYDVTDLNNIVKTDSIKVDARFINDVTISPDGRYGVLSREGASSRKNGVVILDLATPAHPKIAATFDQELAGGVHNMFATNDHLFAVSGGAKYVIIDVKDIYAPKYVSEYRHPNAGLHDLWVHDGIAYSAQGGAGTVVVDVGNGKYGGSIAQPKLVTVFPIKSGHEIFPYFQKSTGKVYLFIGDEEMNRRGRVWPGTNYMSSIFEGGGVAQTSGGYTHIVDFTDPMHPKQVARYHIDEFGTHDIIVQDDVLYQAYYDGGVRLVDVSGELLGNLYDQGREIAVFKPYDPAGRTANAPYVMNAMPWKGHTLFTDFNTGLWAIKLEPKAPAR